MPRADASMIMVGSRFIVACVVDVSNVVKVVWAFMEAAMVSVKGRNVVEVVVELEEVVMVFVEQDTAAMECVEPRRTVEMRRKAVEVLEPLIEELVLLRSAISSICLWLKSVESVCGNIRIACRE